MIRLENKSQILTRLQTANGHLASTINMLENDRCAADILKQLMAVRAALGQISALVYNQEVDAFARKMRNNASQQERFQEMQKLLNLFHTQIYRSH